MQHQDSRTKSVESLDDEVDLRSVITLTFATEKEQAEQSQSAYQPLKIGLSVDEVEPWQRFPYLVRGYRKGGTYWCCLKSLFKLHNETYNAWTMILSLAVGVSLFIYCATELQPATVLDFLPFTALLVAQVLHTPCSVGYHLFMCQSAAVANLWRRMDLSLVLVLNVLTTFGLGYYTWGPYATLIATGIVAAVAAYGISNIVALKEGQPLDRVKVVSMIGLTALGYYIPVCYRGVASALVAGDFTWELAAAIGMLLCHGVGGGCYATHWPQRQFPGKFDIAVSSIDVPW